MAKGTRLGLWFCLELHVLLWIAARHVHSFESPLTCAQRGVLHDPTLVGDCEGGGEYVVTLSPKPAAKEVSKVAKLAAAIDVCRMLACVRDDCAGSLQQMLQFGNALMPSQTFLISDQMGNGIVHVHRYMTLPCRHQPRHHA